MYASSQDIVDLYGADFLLLVAQRGDETALAGELTAAAITDALAQASSQADSYLSTRYAVPVASPPRVLQISVINIACHHLAATHDRMTAIIRQRYEDAIAWLKDISNGKAALGAGIGSEGETQTTPPPEAAEIVSNPPLFKRGAWS